MWDNADITVAQQAAKTSGYTEHNNFHTMTNRQWTNEEKRRIVYINLEERQKGNNFMKRIKDQRDGEFPEKKKNSSKSGRQPSCFAKEGWGGEMDRKQTTKMHKNTE